MNFSNGKTETRGFDLQYRPGSISVPGVVSLSYTYGLSGNISSVTDGLAVSGSFAPAVPDNEYGYAAGSDRLDSLTGGQSVSLSYDANGNITAKGNLTFEYFQDNRLSTVRQDGSIIALYDYNSLGQRTQKTVGDLTTLFHYDLNGNLICETGPDGTLLKEYVYLGNLPLAMIVYGTEVSISYYHTNHLGTPVLITDAAGQAVWKADYYPFGKVGVTVATVENNLRFPGQYFDEETGLHYNWHRYYDPDTGRYLTPDPIGLAGGINPFVYVLNDPVNYIDPLGLMSGGPKFYWDGVKENPTLKQKHYDRLQYNISPDFIWDVPNDWTQLSPKNSVFHQQGEGNENNIKFVSADGKYEGVYDECGNLVTPWGMS